jgi:hypothetical protein
MKSGWYFGFWAKSYNYSSTALQGAYGHYSHNRHKTVSEVSEAELREWEEGQEAEELGAGGEPPLFLPTPDFMASSGEVKWFLLSLFPLSFPLLFPWCASFLLGTGLGGRQRGACNVPPPRGQRTGNGLYLISP